MSFQSFLFFFCINLCLGYAFYNAIILIMKHFYGWNYLKTDEEIDENEAG